MSEFERGSLVILKDSGRAYTTARETYIRISNTINDSDLRTIPYNYDSRLYEKENTLFTILAKEGDKCLLQSMIDNKGYLVREDGLEKIEDIKVDDLVTCVYEDKSNGLYMGNISKVTETECGIYKNIRVENTHRGYVPRATRFVKVLRKDLKELSTDFTYGDVVKGISSDYGITNSSMTKGVVVGLRRSEMYVRILKHEEEHWEEGRGYWVKNSITDFELVDELKGIRKEKGEIMNKDLTIKNIKNIFENKKEEEELLKKRIKRQNDYIKTYWKEITSARTLINEYKGRLIALERSGKDFEEKIKNEIEMIENIELIKGFSVEGEWVKIITDYIDFYDTVGNKYEGNKYDIRLNLKTGDLKFNPLDSSRLYESYWNKDEKESPHPHVGYNDYCLGNAGDMLCEFIANRQLFNSIQVIISFLQQCNEEDWAGRWVSDWKCIDEYGNEIENPQTGFKRCSCCEEIIGEDDSSYTCQECGEVVCGECIREINNEDICTECLGNNYTFCDVCKEYHDNCDMHVCEDCGKDVCEECKLQSKEGDIACSKECMLKEHIYCEMCEEYVREENTEKCDKCGESFCSSCLNEYNNKKYCDSCLNDIEEEEEENNEEDGTL